MSQNLEPEDLCLNLTPATFYLWDLNHIYLNACLNFLRHKIVVIIIPNPCVIRFNTYKSPGTTSHLPWTSITAILRLILEHSDYAYAERHTDANGTRPGFCHQVQVFSRTFLQHKTPSVSDPEMSSFGESIQHRIGICFEAWIWRCCLGNQAHSSASSWARLKGVSNVCTLWGIVPRDHKTMGEGGKVRARMDHLMQSQRYRGEGVDSGSPTILSQDSYYTFKNNERPQKSFLSVKKIYWYLLC